jgi:hypothetical protein
MEARGGASFWREAEPSSSEHCNMREAIAANLEERQRLLRCDERLRGLYSRESWTDNFLQFLF